MIGVLESKNKFVFLDGTIKKPDSTDPLFPTWRRCNDFVLSGVRATISSLIQESIEDITDASVLWQEYSKIDTPMVNLSQFINFVLIFFHWNKVTLQLVVTEQNSRIFLTSWLFFDLSLDVVLRAMLMTLLLIIGRKMRLYTFFKGWMTILLLLVPKSLVLIPFLSWTRHFQGLKNEERKQLSIKVHTNPNALSQLPQSNPATTSHTSNLVATDNIITSSSISGKNSTSF